MKMIKEFVDAWDKNKNNLETYFKNTSQTAYNDYYDLVKLVFELVINQHVDRPYDTSNIQETILSSYQGCIIYLIQNKDAIFPNDCVYTSLYYGSCELCDTLLGIRDLGYGLPNEQQVKDYMTLCLHIIERCHYIEG